MRRWMALCVAMFAWGGRGETPADGAGKWVVALVMPQGERLAEPTEGMLVLTRVPALVRFRIENWTGGTRDVQVDAGAACALELTDAEGRTAVVRQVQPAPAPAGAALPVATRALVNGDFVMVEWDLAGPGVAGVPANWAGGERVFDARAVYTTVRGQRVRSKPYTLISRLPPAP